MSSSVVWKQRRFHGLERRAGITRSYSLGADVLGLSAILVATSVHQPVSGLANTNPLAGSNPGANA